MAAKTVGNAFNQFANKITPTAAQKETMSGRRDKAHEVLKDAFAGSNMPLVKTKLIGSAGRNTIIRPIDDVDVFAVFNDDAVWNEYQSDAKKLLYRVRDALNTKYNVKVGSRGQAVRLFFTETPNVEIVPAFPVTTGGYCIPRGNAGRGWLFGSTWQMTDPYVHETFLSKRNAELGNNLNRLTRFLKRWNAVHSRRFASFHLELLVQAPFSSLGTNSRVNCHRFFEWAPQHLDVQDPAGHSGGMMNGVDFVRRQAMTGALKAAYERSGQALEAENKGNHSEAIRFWRIIFGDEFPAYG
jgi:Second Messenger Oligonucleotide or Dinucleotide Synthetase domain